MCLQSNGTLVGMGKVVSLPAAATLWGFPASKPALQKEAKSPGVLAGPWHGQLAGRALSRSQNNGAAPTALKASHALLQSVTRPSPCQYGPGHRPRDEGT